MLISIDGYESHKHVLFFPFRSIATRPYLLRICAVSFCTCDVHVVSTVVRTPVMISRRTIRWKWCGSACWGLLGAG